MCIWGGGNAHPCLFIQSSGPTTSTTMYTPSYTSHVPPPQVLHTSDCYRLRVHSMCVWGQSAQPHSIIQASATTIAMTMYSPPYASYIPPLQVLRMLDRYRVRALAMHALGPQCQPCSIIQASAPHHRNDCVQPTLRISYTTTASLTHVGSILSACARYAPLGAKMPSPAQSFKPWPPPSQQLCTAYPTHLIYSHCKSYARQIDIKHVCSPCTFGGQNLHPCSIIQSLGPTTLTAMYTPSYTSHVPPLQVLSDVEHGVLNIWVGV